MNDEYWTSDQRHEFSEWLYQMRRRSAADSSLADNIFRSLYFKCRDLEDRLTELEKLT